VSDEPNNHEASGTRRPPPPSLARPGVAPPPKATASKLPPPPPFPAPPPARGAPAASAGRAPAPSVGAVPRPTGPAGPTPSRATGVATPRVADPVAASRAARAAGTRALGATGEPKAAASSLEALRRGAGVSVRAVPAASPGGVGLPPPPEFLPIGLEAEDDAALASVTLPGIPPALVGEHASEPMTIERDASGRSIVEPLPVPAPLDPAPAAVDDDAHDPPSVAEGGRAGAAEDDGIDIDVSEDTLPRVALVREAFPPLPSATTPAPSQVPTAPLPVVRTQARSRRAGTASTPAHVPLVPSRRPLALWIGVGAGVGIVISIVALLWLTGSGPDKEAAREPAATVDPATPQPATNAAPAPAPADPKTETVAPVAPPHEQPAAVEPTPAEPAPAPAEPAPAEPDEPDEDASVIVVERDDTEYRAAAAEYEATGSQASLLAMTTAACALGHGPKARAAFRKLVGRALRSQAMEACQAAKVDVTSTVDGYTGPELLAQARAALAAGDIQAAFDKAHASNKVERSSEAVLVKGLAACKLGDGEQAERLLPHVTAKSRPRLVAGCREAGIELRP
jgi:hypothetical protein